MHEMALAEGIRSIVDEAVARQGLGRVKAVVVEIGVLSAVEVGALAFCFEAVMKGGAAEGARMDVVRVDGQGWCLDCAQTIMINRLYDPCPLCGGYHVQPTGGTQMRVRELEVESAD